MKKWYKTKNKDELEKVYRSLIPKLKGVARANGYNLLVHGSLRRDLDLLAVPWVDKAIQAKKLAKLLHVACIGKDSPYLLNRYELSDTKPHNRLTIVLMIGNHGKSIRKPQAVYIDLGIMALSSNHG